MLEDVREERISADYVRDVYGVVVAHGNIQLDETQKMRNRLRAGRDPRKPQYLKYFLEPLGLGDYVLTGDRNLSAR